MKLEVQQPPVEHSGIIRNLMELYQYDFSEFESEDVNEEGLYGYKYLDYYWTVPGHFPFLIKVNEKLAGFALIREITPENRNNQSYFIVSEFFVMKKYRKGGIGKQVAIYLFNLFPGTWEVAELATNLPAQKFWRKVISGYTNDSYSEIRKETWNGPIQRFKTT